MYRGLSVLIKKVLYSVYLFVISDGGVGLSILKKFSLSMKNVLSEKSLSSVFDGLDCGMFIRARSL